MRFRVVLLALSLPVFCTFCYGADRPNIVWIVSEDNSIHYLDHFFDGGAKTPSIKALAEHGLTYDHAFSNAPVCSVARTTLATGCYGPRIGTQFHRRYKLAPMPNNLRMFPAYLRDAGYYTTNNSKKDYAAEEGVGVWDESSNRASWRNRPDKDQPFFHMQSHGQSHEGTLHFGQSVFENKKTESDPAKVKLADYHPDIPIFRYTHAFYQDRMKAIDSIVGDTIASLNADGLLEDTFVFYFGDHGGVLPRSKGYLYESGLHVPLVVRVPKNFQHLVDGDNGSRVEGFVSFVDFGPTVLRLAGCPIPEQVDGAAFLGKGISSQSVSARDESFGYADRFDEKYDLVRSIRKGKYQYIRSYQPYLPDGLNNNYRYKSLAYLRWREMFETKKLTGPAKLFFEPKPLEQLFDCESDPHQVRNLAGDQNFADILTELRNRLNTQLKQLPDLSFYPESHLIKHALNNPVAFGQENKQEIASLIDVADLALLKFEEAQTKLQTALRADNPMIRYWGAMACTAFGKQASSLAEDARPLLKDKSMTVRIRAAEFLGLIGECNPQEILTEIVNTTEDAVVATEALNSVVWFRDFFDDRYPIKRSDFHPICSGGDIDDRLNYINGTPYPPKTRQKRKRIRKTNDLSSVSTTRNSTSISSVLSRPKTKTPDVVGQTKQVTAKNRDASPNIVLVLTDDLGYGDLGCYGADRVKTPRIDRLANQGIRLTHAYAPSSTCTPTRYSIMTGEYAWRQPPTKTAILDGDSPLSIEPGRTTLPGMLRQSGYRTGLVGKWHLGLGDGKKRVDFNREIRPGPLEIGFDYAYFIPATVDRVPSVWIKNHRVDGLDPDDPIAVSYVNNISDEPTGIQRPDLLKQPADKQHSCTIINGISRIGYMKGGSAARFKDEELADTVVEKSIDFIERNHDRPFFLCVGLFEPHVPRTPHPRFAGSSDCGVRGDVIHQIDWQTGQILDALDQKGLTENTIFLFTSDNGPVMFDGYFDRSVEDANGHRPAGVLHGWKYLVYEGGTRVPFIARWPGKFPVGQSDNMFSLADLMATFAAVCDQQLESSQARDSLNQLPMLIGRSAKPVRTSIIQHGISGAFAVRDGNWKYIPANSKEGPKDMGSGANPDDTRFAAAIIRKPLLFNLNDDPEETTNLFEKMPGKAKQMQTLFDSIRNSNDRAIETTN